MLKHWIPWRFIIRHTARAYGVIDPLTLLARLRRFAQPSEVQEPIELLRAGLVFHARGLVNTRAIQHNLDWVWPFWVERQFNPRDPSFIPRAFSLTHVNLTHRNWTAVGRPDLPLYPIVDPRGLVTPLHDGWSLDFWMVPKQGAPLFPSRLAEVGQELVMSPELLVRTEFCEKGQRLVATATVEMQDGIPRLVLGVTAFTPEGGWVAAALRPFNPEGVQFVDRIEFESNPPRWRVNSKTLVEMSEPPQKVLFSDYETGDVCNRLDEPARNHSIVCGVGMATAAALFPLAAGVEREISLAVPIDREMRRESVGGKSSRDTWDSVLVGTACLQVPDRKLQFLYDAAVRTLVLLSAGDVVPGPYTYHRFWFRDACFMLHALLALGFADRCRRLLATFPSRQKHSGYFRSQEGEWDSNGQVLWIAERFHRMTGTAPEPGWLNALLKGAEWIVRKRLPGNLKSLHAGLLPPGFSAEHFGPNDYYYWDDFWGIAGLRAGARLAESFGSEARGKELAVRAEDFAQAVFASIAAVPEARKRGAIPASPYRRLDAGAIGSLAADYPLQLFPPGDPEILGTATFLMDNCFHQGAFFQDMIHSGLNPYLTLSIAQTLLRCGDPRYRTLIMNVAGLASPTGQWPEAIHPFTGGGCMGDGQHGWAAAEWVMALRNLFVREEGDRLVLGSGLFPEWLDSPEGLGFGPGLTTFGRVSLRIDRRREQRFLAVEADWLDRTPAVEVRVPGFRPGEMTDFSRPWPLVPAGCPK